MRTTSTSKTTATTIGPRGISTAASSTGTPWSGSATSRKSAIIRTTSCTARTFEKIVEPFHFSGDLLLDSGAHASVGSDNLGFIDYSVENCVGQACDITINNFGLHYAEYTGTFYDAADDPYPFSVDGIWTSLAEPVRGTITPSVFSSPVVSFPFGVFWVRLSTGAVALDGTPISSFGSVSLPIDQVAGTYSGGVLTLYIGYETVDATMSLTLTTF
ncbi:hypothetical protein [Nannocystis pusilla]|uniref:hypothetical protein n=1 Tax=Nannocystis pusilla TaxID=889268 RepID=UPI003DA3F483